MRYIHVRFRDRESIRTRVEMDGGTPVILLKNNSGYEIVLEHPKLKRKIIGVVIEDHWSTQDRWFSEDHCDVQNPWRSR